MDLSKSKRRRVITPVAAFSQQVLENLLHYDGALLVVSGLPGTDDRAIRLLLIDIAAFDPDVLNRSRGLLNDGLLNNHRLSDNRLLDDHRLRDHRLLDDHRLGDHGRSRDNGRSSDNGRRRDHRRRDHGIDDGATDESADETRPEIASAASPSAVMMDDRSVMPTVSAESGTGESRAASDASDQNNDNLLIIHQFPFLQLLLTQG